MTDSQAHTAARIATAIELRHAGSLRRDLAAGALPRDPALSAIRDCLRHARFSRAKAQVIARCFARSTAGAA